MTSRNIVLVTGRWRRDQTLYPVEKLLTILKIYANSITWIATKECGLHFFDNSVRVVEVPYRIVKGASYRNLFYYILHQIQVISLLVRTEGNIVIFAFDSDLFIFPILFGRLMGKKVIIRSDGRPSAISMMRERRDNPLKEQMVRLIERVTYATANKIVPESSIMVAKYHLERYWDKIEIGSLYVDTNRFMNSKVSGDRRFRVGFVGRLSEEKGVLQFAKSLSTILLDSDAEAMIIGYGHLAPEVNRIVSDSGVRHQVVCTGKIDNRVLPHYLNEIRVIVVPSEFEGLPNIVLESMACGCIVVATPVGGIPDLIQDGVTGFILADRSPEAIARGISRAYTHHDFERIIENAHTMIEQHYTLSAAIERYKAILSDSASAR